MPKARKNATSAIDLEGMTDDELTALAVAVRKEAQRRGIEAGVEVWACALADEEATQIAREAAERETERLRAEEARRIAADAARKVREEAERKRVEKEAAAATERDAKVRALAVRARELFGSDQDEFSVSIWERPGDKRVYIGHGFGNNWVEYYHTGNSRTAPGTATILPAILRDLAAHLDIAEADACGLIKDYCEAICQGWNSLKVEVNTVNAPLAKDCTVTKFLLKNKHTHFFGADGDRSYTVAYQAKADRFATPELAIEAAPKYCGDRRIHLAKSVEEIEVVPIQIRVPFPPKGA